MKVKELIAILQSMPQDAEVVMSKDAEGNRFSPFSSCDKGSVPVHQVTRYEFDVFYSDSHTDADCCLKPGERDSFAKAICLWPTN